MKMRITCLVVFLLSLLITSSTAETLTARQIMEHARENTDVKDEIFNFDMELINSRGQIRKRSTQHYFLKEKKTNLEKYIIRFKSPRNIKGTGLLTVERSDADDDQWLYLPAIKRERRISSANKKDYFLGTDMTYEDVKLEKVEDFDYKIIDTGLVDGSECWVIEAIPATANRKSETGYSKRHLWVRTDIYVIPKVRFYGNGNKLGKLIKESREYVYKEIADNKWRPERIEINNFDRKHKTVMLNTDRKVNQGLPKRYFTIRSLKEGIR